MSFERLPADWDHDPLTDRDRAADVVDLFLSLDDRRRNCLLLLLCDDDHRLLQPICIEGVDWCCSATDRAQAFRLVTEQFGLPFIAALSTWRGLPIDVARSWLHSAQKAAARWGGQLLQCYVATGRGVTPVAEEVRV